MLLIKLTNVTKKFGDFTAVDNVTLQIKKGEFVGLLGPNGAGKSTIIRMLTGLSKATAGQIYIDGQRVSRDNIKVKKKTGIVPQYTNLDKELTAYENLVFAAKLFKMKRKAYESKIKELMQLMDLEQYKDCQAKNLSGGTQRRLMVAKALINDPKIIFLDEPTAGVDLNGRRKIWDILKAMKAKGKTVLLTTHYMDEADYLCSRVCLINDGKIFEDDTPKNLKTKLGLYTVEYFNDQMVTEYVHFKAREEALAYTSKIKDFSYTVRKTTLEDVFYNLTKRKVV